VIVWYKHGRGDPWRCVYSRPTPMRYQTVRNVLDTAEKMMRGDHSDILWRKTEDQARNLIWC